MLRRQPQREGAPLTMKKSGKTASRKDKLGAEARADFADRERQATDEAKVELRQGAEQTPAGERRTGDADTNWDAATDSADAFPGHVPSTDVNEVDLMGRAAGLTYADDEPLDYSKVDRRDEERWELNPASAQPGRGRDEADEEDAEDLFGDEALQPEAPNDEDETLDD
jgi:hypothetical protein